jgi:predicted RNase H-like HicB family nuclease
MQNLIKEVIEDILSEELQINKKFLLSLNFDICRAKKKFYNLDKNQKNRLKWAIEIVLKIIKKHNLEIDSEILKFLKFVTN